ncbi:hypothetical protein [Robertmurraya massiliosenegalensis]|uniref:hypothetical protein n=1 Tax=Robertmurraya massiliosenegalensis TaxID=1287657 RepID=UPI0002F6F8AC|nr:hypothetical protein [Robertmurraya massiliosenegalensis]
MRKRKDVYVVLVAVFDTELNENQILIGEGLTLVEAIVRGIEFELSDEELRNIIHVYGPDDIEGLYEWYLSRGIYLSEPMIIQGESIFAT